MPSLALTNRPIASPIRGSKPKSAVHDGASITPSRLMNSCTRIGAIIPPCFVSRIDGLPRFWSAYSAGGPPEWSNRLVITRSNSLRLGWFLSYGPGCRVPDRGSAAPSAGGLTAGRDPVRPPGAGIVAAAQPGPGPAARRVPRSRGGQLRAAGGRGIPGRPARVGHPGGPAARDRQPAAAHTAPGRPAVPLRPAARQADFHAFPRARWKAALLRALRDLPDSRLSYAGHRGIPELRAAVAGYLARMRGVVVEPD